LGIQTKTDKKDSFIIAHYAQATSPAVWQPEPLEIRALKALIARLDAIEKDLRREQNRLEKTQLAQSPLVVVDSLEISIKPLTEQKHQFEKLIHGHIDPHPSLKKDRALLDTVPGVGPVIASRMIAIMRSRSFNSAAQLAAFCGLVPVENTSGASVRGKPRLSKAGCGMFRAKLYIASLSATQCNPLIRQHYQQLIARGKTNISALNGT